MTRKWSSISAETSLSANITSSQTTMVVTNATNLLGGVNPAGLSTTNDFVVVIDPDTSSEEIVRVTAAAGNLLTIIRGHDSSTAKIHTSGAAVRHMAIGEDFRLNAYAAAAYPYLQLYLGSKATDPSVDNDGNVLLSGATYFNSGTLKMRVWTGSAWTDLSSSATVYRNRFNATAGQTSFSGLDGNGVTLQYAPGFEQVYLNGVLLVRGVDYVATTGTSITGVSACAVGDVFECISFTAFQVADVIPITSFNAKGDLLAATAGDAYGVVTVGANGTVLTADSTQTTGIAWTQGLPTQTSNATKFLQTDGTTASWQAVVTDPTPTVFLMMGA
jgi:hypothetical protein